MSNWNPEPCAIYPRPCITARPPYACPLKHHCQSFFFSPTLTRARANTHIHTCKQKRTYVHTHKRKKKMYSHADNSFNSRKLSSHSIWFVISFSALIISQYLGHSPLIVSRVLRSVLLSHPDGWALRPQSEAPGDKRRGRGEGT